VNNTLHTPKFDLGIEELDEIVAPVDWVGVALALATLAWALH
jgi:hypothetical protein